MDSNPFLSHAQAQVKAQQIANAVNDQQRAAFLLWKAYVKRIKPAPDSVALSMWSAVDTVAHDVQVVFETSTEASMVADLAGDLLWNTLDEKAQREWLLKAI